jgi:hypothetical protein
MKNATIFMVITIAGFAAAQTPVTESWSLRVIAGGHICNIIDEGMDAHLAALRNLPYLDTVPQGGYAYDPKGVSNGVRVGIGLQTQLTQHGSALADVVYSQLGETLHFSSVVPAQLSVSINYVEASLLLEYDPQIPILILTRFRAGGYAGLLAYGQETFSIASGHLGFPATISQSWNLRPWLSSPDAGMIISAGTAYGKGASSLGADIYFMRGFSDLRSDKTKNNKLFPQALHNILVGLSLEYQVRVFP